jgi:hypothetical protein
MHFAVTLDREQCVLVWCWQLTDEPPKGILERGAWEALTYFPPELPPPNTEFDPLVNRCVAKGTRIIFDRERRG